MIESTRSETTFARSLLSDREHYVPRGVANGSNVLVARALGARVWDVDGREYVDFAAGIGTLNVGHGQPRVLDAIRKQTQSFTHTCFHVAMYDGYIRLAKRLADICPGQFAKKTLLLNSGAEAVENAIKIARAATRRPAVVAFTGGFHGRTLLGMSLTGKVHPYKSSFAQLAADVYRAIFPYPYRPPRGIASSDLTDYCLSFLREMFVTHVAPDQVAAMIVEPVLGESGCIVPPKGFLPGLREICDEHGILLIFDEIQTGFGRTGRMFAVEHESVVPDLLVLAKSLAAGLPLSAVIGRSGIMDVPDPGSLGGTYGGNPIACAAALAVLDIFEEQQLVESARVMGQWLIDGLAELQERHRWIGDVRGLGAMVAMELVEDRVSKKPAVAATRKVHDAATREGLLLAKAGMHANVVRLLPPLVATRDDVNQGLHVLDLALRELT